MSSVRFALLGKLVVAGWLLMAAFGSVAVGSLAMATPAAAQVRISAIEVSGNRRVEPETVRSYLQFSTGSTYEPALVDQSLRALFGTGLFSDVQIDLSGSTVIVTVVENPVINQVAFEGNSEVDTATLMSEIQLKPRSVFTRARAQADVQRILDVYRRQGRFAANVEPKLIDIEQNRVNLVFEIVEGSATKVKGISFIGNRAFSDSQLRDIISTTQSGWFDFLKGTSIYDPDRLNLDRELLRQYYLKNGYADARIVAANSELDRDGSGFFLTFTVEEGELYRVGDVAIESALPELNSDALRRELLFSSGEVYNATLVDKTVERLTLSVAKQGYAFARVRPRATPDFYARTISLNFQVDEGPRVYIERINVFGNERTKDYVIRREFRLVEGDAFNPLLVDQAEKRLKSLGFFKSVEVKRRPGSAPDRVVLDVEIIEQSTGELSFGAGYSTSEGVIGDVSISERNLLGNGQFLRLRLSGSIERFQVDLSFTEPRFLDRNLAAGFDLFHKEVDQRDTSGFRSRKSGATVRLGFPLAEDLWGQASYTLSRDQIYDVSNNASIAVLDAAGGLRQDPTNPNNFLSESDTTYWTSSLGGALTFDKRNHPRNPTSGYYVQLSTDLAGLGGDVEYVRVQGEGRGYYPIAEGLTFVGRLIGGHIEGWGDDDVRLLDLFFRGGETVRGFDRSGYGPRDLTTGDALGGKTYWAATAELRFPIPFIPEELGISGAVFADAGSLFNASERARSLSDLTCGKNITVNNTSRGFVNANTGGNGVCLVDDESVRASVGGSVLWNSPVGPLRMDFAYNLLEEEYDEDQFFRFGASTKF
ncbi:MAG: outer membrane protein assembly factor BamA [Hyphomicrobiaceae bacterium]|nr:outer membrane protein assembly factor BamA [Hyphomicrobiaceae bacterium]